MGNALKPLAKNVLITLELTAAADAALYENVWIWIYNLNNFYCRNGKYHENS